MSAPLFRMVRLRPEDVCPLLKVAQLVSAGLAIPLQAVWL